MKNEPLSELPPDFGTTVIEGFRFTEVARDRERDLGGILHVGDVSGDARTAARRAGVDAIHCQPAVFRIAAMRREQQHRRPQLHLPVARDDARHELEDVVIGARGWNGLKHVAVDDLLTTSALHVDNRRLAKDRHGFFESADTKVDVDGGGQRAGQLDPFTPDGVETRQGHRHRVGSWRQRDDAVLPGPVGDDRADLFDQNGAGGFHRHTRQHATRRVSDDAGNGRLGISRRRHEHAHQRDQEERRGSLDPLQHYCPPHLVAAKRPYGSRRLCLPQMQVKPQFLSIFITTIGGTRR
jgi:hypothetical protein